MNNENQVLRLNRIIEESKNINRKIARIKQF